MTSCPRFVSYCSHPVQLNPSTSVKTYPVYHAINLSNPTSMSHPLHQPWSHPSFLELQKDENSYMGLGFGPARSQRSRVYALRDEGSPQLAETFRAMGSKIFQHSTSSSSHAGQSLQNINNQTSYLSHGTLDRHHVEMTLKIALHNGSSIYKISVSFGINKDHLLTPAVVSQNDQSLQACRTGFLVRLLTQKE